ncbi:putative low specificity L-threonine aldolase protein [Dactylonectria macrodidyma]|uniref:Low specificity L-threonine aldolase protein n=1 Tax=Dactylonectria macrodidyma TaxID=307937 RepID=A0A9P9E191_9HYPO|nr:putative low specificity L-threonine aldolase protein [Dactylonectria macrodidyma]
MNFGSDNYAGAHPAITASLANRASGYAEAYSTSDLDLEVQRRFSAIFERDVAVFYVATGTAANCLALASVAKPGGLVLAHHEAHIMVDECGAPEFLTGQTRLAPIKGRHGKMEITELRRQAERISSLDVHGGRLNAISVTQPTESGTVYSLDELDEIAKVAKAQNIPLHMDGARFANGLVSLGCSPAEMTWKRGVDMLSFGGTKNGCWCAEAVVLFDPKKAHEFAFIQKRAAQLLSKSRFVSAQFEAYFDNELWLDNARHSNKMAADLADAFSRSASSRLIRKPQTNELFVLLKNDTVDKLEAEGVVFLRWPGSDEVEIRDDEQLCRFVTSFETRREDIESLKSLIL